MREAQELLVEGSLKHNFYWRLVMLNLKGRDFLKLLDFSAEEIGALIDLAAELKAKKKAGIPHRLCEGKNIALIFEKTSTRTRCSFEVAGYDLGMGVTYLDPTGSQIGKKASNTAVTVRRLSRSSRSILKSPYGTVLPMNFTPRRFLPTFLQ